MKPRALLQLLICTCLLACDKTIVGESRQSNSEVEKEIQNKCILLSKEGQVADIIANLDKQMTATEEILAKSIDENTPKQVRARALLIKESASQLISILGSEYTEIRYTQFLQWRIDHQDESEVFGVFGNYSPVKVQIEKVFTWNGEDLGLVDDFLISQNRNHNISIRLVRPASLVELCQLQKLLNVVVKVDFESEFGGRVTKHYRLKMEGNQ